MNMKDEPLHLVYAADGRFAMPLAVSLHSVLRRLPPDRSAVVFVVDGGFSAGQRRRVEEVSRRGAAARRLSIEWVHPERSWWRGLELDFSGKHLNETVLYRLGIPHFVPEDVDRVIYLDADVLAKADVTELEGEIDDRSGVAAVRDYCMATWGLRYWGRAEPLAELGLTGDEPYFNAGVLGINLRYWRDHGVAEQAARFLQEHRSIAGFYDQDALNHVLRGQWRMLHPAWNFPPTCRDTVSRRGATVEERTGETFDALQARVRLVHYTGAKPWDQGYTNPERPAFVAELRRSGWFGPAGYAAWSGRWYSRLALRAAEKFWVYRVKPALQRPQARVATSA